MRCATPGCLNHSDEGDFIGLFCSPCHKFYTGGTEVHSQAYVNAVAFAERLIAERKAKMLEPPTCRFCGARLWEAGYNGKLFTCTSIQYANGTWYKGGYCTGKEGTIDG